MFSHLSVTAYPKWELFVNKILRDVYTDVCVGVCVCVTVMNWINYGVWYITNDFVIYILHVLTNAFSS